MQELEEFANGISADVVSVSATPSYRPSMDPSCEDENYGFDVIQSDNSANIAQTSEVEDFNTGLAISSALSSLPSRPVQQFWENCFLGCHVRRQS